MLALVHRFFEQRGAVFGAVLVVVLLLVAVVGPWLATSPYALDIDHGLSVHGAPLPPSSAALLGTDQLGRDVWARLANGAGTSLWIASVATALAVASGLAVGLVAGYAGGRTDEVVMRLADLALAFPFLLFAILLAALLRQSSLATTNAPVIVPLAVVGWTAAARVIRAKVLVLARSEHVIAARVLGASTARIMLHHLLPNVIGTLAVVAAFNFAQNLLAESVLSYLGLGAPPPAPTWGRMLFEGRAYYRTAPWLVLAPGLAIVLAVAAFNLLGEGLRTRFDPRGRP